MSELEPTIENALIKSTHLGLEDHGIMTFFLHLEYNSSGQGFGGYVLGWKKEDTGFGIAVIRQVLKVVGVEKWEDLPGKHIRSEHVHYEVRRIGNFIKDEWLDVKALAKEYHPDA